MAQKILPRVLADARAPERGRNNSWFPYPSGSIWVPGSYAPRNVDLSPVATYFHPSWCRHGMGIWVPRVPRVRRQPYGHLLP